MIEMKDLTPEIMAKIPEYKRRCTEDLYSGVESANFNRKISTEYVEKIYEIAGREKPVVIFATDPLDYQRKFRALQTAEGIRTTYGVYLKKNGKGISDEELQALEVEPSGVEGVKSHYLFLCSSYHRVYLTWYKFIQDEFNIEHKNKELLDWLYEKANNNICRCYFTPMYVLVLRMPKRIRRNDIGFHSIDAPAIEWDGYGMYYINGRRIPTEYWDKVVSKTLTMEEFMAIDAEDTKACIVTLMTEKFGNEYLMEFLDARVTNEERIDHSSGYSEVVRLWKTNRSFSFLQDLEGNMDQPYAWLELTCPSSGSKYLCSVSPHFTSAVEACKFHRPQSIPMDLAYDFSQFNN